MSQYTDILGKIRNSRNGTRKIANNTYAHMEGDNIIIQLHENPIITITPDGDVMLNSCGWYTSTTKDRMNSFIPVPFRVTQERGVWYVWNYQTCESVPFADNMIVSEDGTISGAGSMRKVKDQERLGRRISSYVEQYVNELIAGQIPEPSAGDCWFCALTTNEGHSLGESMNDNDHLISHINDAYFVPSLMLRAIESFPVSQMSLFALQQLWNSGESLSDLESSILSRDARSSLRRYLRGELNLA